MNIEAKKSFGQNFLINKEIQKRIVSLAKIENEDVIEIGPGLGAITNLMVSKVKSLKAYELDNRLYEYLKDKKYNDNIEIINQDFLEANLFSENKKIVVGNIPYNITSLIIFKLFDNMKYLSSATLMVQKEVAQRITSLPKNKSYSKLSVFCQMFANVKYGFDVKAKEFNPAPKVDSAVIRIDFNKQDLDILNNYEKLKDFIKLCFQFKRKTLYNNLISNYKKEKIVEAIEKLNLKPAVRSEEIEVLDFYKLFKLLEN
ncbi:16S rRNA (adenine(1518)-N(6)/adenine(1519)-N(6))-dimethyltransferase RsmA [Mycoplasma struthionis]|uniref:Ribosomal RNA small subunit methyltransferase A n=1 Tax=Mycoplasma struthionis TaxID=538220 RepID=A0A502M272_9MOLU|nr:16S rRNA (adenine(1518)-N(6)/adenine(1519)-N(6))-dimethyltransferase RsmA [Mycoplasma struthionis]TPI02297.1 ribosomal RNA small subunit methyltransferase A [Mycoplasma struthionis]